MAHWSGTLVFNLTHAMAHWPGTLVFKEGQTIGVYYLCLFCDFGHPDNLLWPGNAMQWPGWKLSYATLKEASVGLQTNCKQLTVQ